MACQHFPDEKTLRLQAGAGEDDIIHLPNGLDRVHCERQEEKRKVLTAGTAVAPPVRTGWLGVKH